MQRYIITVCLLLSVTTIQAFDISITGGPTPSINVSGSDQRQTNWEEISNNFGINEERLKELSENLLGMKPDDAAISDPTPFGPDHNEYARYNFIPVTMVVDAYFAEILETNTEDVYLKSQEFVNNSTLPGTYTTQLTQEVQNSIETTWSTESTFTFSTGVSINFEFGSAESNWSSAFAFQQGGSQTNTTTVGDLNGITVVVNPGQQVVASLSASKKTLKIRVYYHAYLEGMVVINYSADKKRILNGHHVWAPTVDELGIGKDSPTTTIITQDVMIDYYTEGRTELQSF